MAALNSGVPSAVCGHFCYSSKANVDDVGPSSLDTTISPNPALSHHIPMETRFDPANGAESSVGTDSNI
jgi:hypothetical protein